MGPVLGQQGLATSHQGKSITCDSQLTYFLADLLEGHATKTW
jgi:hypothetical protein